MYFSTSRLLRGLGGPLCQCPVRPWGIKKRFFMAGKPSHAATGPMKRTGHAPVLISGKKKFFLFPGHFSCGIVLAIFGQNVTFSLFFGCFDDAYEPFVSF